MKYWIVTFNTEDYEITQARNFDVLGLPSNVRWKNMLEKTSVGDRIIYYVQKPLYKFAAILEVISEYYYDESRIWARDDEMWPHRINTRPLFVIPNIAEMDVKKIIMKMTTPSEKQKTDKHWALFLRGSMRAINEYDYNVVIAEMQKFVGEKVNFLAVADAINEDIGETRQLSPDFDGQRQSTNAREHRDKDFGGSGDLIFYNVASVGFERANKAHEKIIQTVNKIFADKKYKSFENNHVDLAVEVDGEILLFEMKSATTKKKARVQARAAVGQLFEYEKFDLEKMFKGINYKKIYKILAMDLLPQKEYVSYLNGLGIKVLEVNDDAKNNFASILDFIKK